MKPNYERTYRSLTRLHASASTSRVLNLLKVYQRHGHSHFHAEKPIFYNPMLNRSMVVKHRLRNDETDNFDSVRTVATKVLLPLDREDLKVGARFVFIGQIGYLDLLEEALGTAVEASSPDFRMLHLLNELPSLDPFILREQLRREGVEPDRCYFDISEADLTRMVSFAQRQLTPLVNMSFSVGGGFGSGVAGHAAKLTAKILSNEVDGDLEPLRKVLQLDHMYFEEGVFCWKAFLYYKWQLSELAPRLKDVVHELGAVTPRGRVDSQTILQIESSRGRIRRQIAQACDSIRKTLSIYDVAFDELVTSGKARGFRAFLITAPTLFSQLGERLAGIDHIVSFWRYRFPQGRLHQTSAEELQDLLIDFENSLAFSPHQVEESALSEFALSDPPRFERRRS